MPSPLQAVALALGGGGGIGGGSGGGRVNGGLGLPGGVGDVGSQRLGPAGGSSAHGTMVSDNSHQGRLTGDNMGAAVDDVGRGFEALEVKDAASNNGFVTDQGLLQYSYYSEKRHESNGNPSSDHPARKELAQDWRMRERLKTVSVALVLCLNIGIDPPDVVKTSPCAKLECWVDPTVGPPQKALETIGRNLQQQYEVWQPRAKYRLQLDPSFEDTKKLCCQLRRNAKDERILFHYNGHGVPKPTAGGEIWVFNKTYTQYIPVSIYDIQTWLRSPCIYVYDCSNAGNILLAFNRFAEQRDAEAQRQFLAIAQGGGGTGGAGGGAGGVPPGSHPSPNPQAPGATPPLPSNYVSMRECIQLAACGPKEVLPMHPDLPADVFSCCLTTPIEIALRWFISQNPLLKNITPEMISRIPGRLSDRRTPKGELNWIFTAITDTIAWNVLPHDLFKKLFRQDLMVAALFRNFLLAERILRHYHCTPMSSPVLPETHQHKMWQSWDLAADMCLAQLPALLAAEEGGPPAEYRHSSFFSEQLTAFEVWLSKGSVARKAPEQLPIVLQVLLSQVHRLRALMLLSRFLDLGPWAVNLALSVGIFPYVLKLLQSPAAELKPVLVFIWAKILAVDRSCQNDLLKDNGYTYFINILGTGNAMPVTPNISEHRAMCAFILSVFSHDFRAGQAACIKNDLLPALMLHMNDQDPLLRQWVCICLAKVWEGFSEAKWIGMRENLHESLCGMLEDPVPEVRAAALYAIGALIGDLDKTDQIINIEHNIAISVLVTTADASPLVRKELVVTLARVVQQYIHKFVTAAFDLLEEDRKRTTATLDERRFRRSIGSSGIAGSASTTALADRKLSDTVFRSPSHNSIYGCVWKVLLNLSVDPYAEVASMASKVVDAVNLKLLTSPLMESLSTPMLNISPPRHGSSAAQQHGAGTPTSTQLQAPTPTTPNTQSQSSTSGGSKVTATLKRSASFAYSLRSLAGFGGGSSSTTANSTDNVSSQNSSDQTGLAPGSDGSAPSSSNPSQQRPQSMIVAGNTAPQLRGRSATVTGRPMATVDALLGTDTEDEPSGSGASGENLDIVVVNSTFFEWSAEYFAEPQMRVPEADDPGSIRYTERLWRQQRNEKSIETTRQQQEVARTKKFEDQLLLLQNDGQPAHLATFHQFEPHLCAANDRHLVSVFNFEDGTRLNTFSNANPPGSRITSLKFINEEDTGILMVGSDEGIVRLYRKYEDPKTTELVSTWRALSDLLPTTRGSGLIADWQQLSGSLIVSGDVRHIRIWDAERELCVQDIPTKATTGVTSLSSEKHAGHIIIAGYGDGAIRIYDRRSPRENLVASYNEHSNWILSAHLQQGGTQELISGCTSGNVRIWDLRRPGQSVRRVDGAISGEMTAFTVHDFAPLFACGNALHNIKVYDAQGCQVLSSIKNMDGFLGGRPGSISCLSCHPHRLLLAAGSTTSTSLSIFTQ
ncbi:hypothetical protein HK102_003590 [Quaeritorhiza haematococci]|nr:hypothetical protein HK102_003590 [Quaeritorhiza haematococci]